MDLRDCIKNIKNDNTICIKKFRKMNFIFNALEKGWSIKKKKNNYVFTKNHNNKKEIFLDNYLKKFLENNI